MNPTPEAIDERANTLLDQLNPPNVRPRQVVFSLSKTARILGCAPSHLKMLLEQEGITFMSLGRQRGGVSVSEIARLQLLLEAKARAKQQAKLAAGAAA